MDEKTIDRLRVLRACNEAVLWVRGYDNPQAAWDACGRGDWMLWILGRLTGSPESASRKRLVLCTCACARLALQYAPEGDTRPRKAIETAESWARDEGATLGEVRVADADAATATYAATAAAYPAYAAAGAAYAASAVAASTAAGAADGAAGDDTLRCCADIVRKHYPEAPKLGEKKC